MPNYERALATAQRMIAGAGRLVSVTLAAPGSANADDPLAGPAAPPAPIEGIPAAFLYPSGLLQLGALVTVAGSFAACEQVAMIAADGTTDFKQARFLKDSDNTDWRVVRVDEFKPGEVALLYYIGVKRP